MMPIAIVLFLAVAVIAVCFADRCRRLKAENKVLRERLRTICRGCADAPFPFD